MVLVDVGALIIFGYLRYPCEVDAECCANLAIAHATCAHREDVSAELGFIGIAYITLGCGGHGNIEL